MKKIAVAIIALLSLGLMANKCEVNGPLGQKQDEQKQEQPAPAPEQPAPDQPK